MNSIWIGKLGGDPRAKGVVSTASSPPKIAQPKIPRVAINKHDGVAESARRMGVERTQDELADGATTASALGVIEMNSKDGIVPPARAPGTYDLWHPG